MTLVGIVPGSSGSLLLVSPPDRAALPLLIAGRAVQGLSAACVMPASMALVKTYWDGRGTAARRSMWSIGSWGGVRLAALFGGAMVN